MLASAPIFKAQLSFVHCSTVYTAVKPIYVYWVILLKVKLNIISKGIINVFENMFLHNLSQNHILEIVITFRVLHF